MTKQYKYGTKYSRNLMTEKIRRLLDKNSEAGYAELKKMFGTVTRSIIVTYYSVYKDMFNRSGHLKKRKTYKKSPDTIRAKVRAYFAKHPTHTIIDATKELEMSWTQIHNALYSLQAIGRPVPYHRMTSQERERGKALQIRNYFKENPEATTRECAQALSLNPQYVSYIVYAARKSGKLPSNETT